MKPVQKNHSTIYKSRSLSTCFTRVPLVHSLMLSRSKQDIGGHTLSLSSRLVTIRPDNLDRGRGVGASFTLSLAAREETSNCPRVSIGGRAVLSERAPAREGLRPLLPPCGIVAKMRPPDAVFATCRRPSGIYSFETCLALLPQLFPLRVDPFLLPSAVPKPPRLLLLLEVKLVHTVDSKSWFKQGRKWESCSMNLGLGSKRKRGKVVIFVTV